MNKRSWIFFVKTEHTSGYLDRNGYIHTGYYEVDEWEGLCHQAGQEATRRATLFENISLQTATAVTFESRGKIIGPGES